MAAKGVGSKANPNKEFTAVVKKPGGRVGGTNASVKVSTNPTRYAGGLNKAACAVPTGKLKNKK
jgi:hypothetical protein